MPGIPTTNGMKRASSGYWVAMPTMVVKIASMTQVSQVLKLFISAPDVHVAAPWAQVAIERERHQRDDHRDQHERQRPREEAEAPQLQRLIERFLGLAAQHEADHERRAWP